MKRNAIRNISNLDFSLAVLILISVGMFAAVNRRDFLTLAGNQLKLANRKGQSLLLVYLDLDGLKQIDDAYGYDAG